MLNFEQIFKLISKEINNDQNIISYSLYFPFSANMAPPIARSQHLKWRLFISEFKRKFINHNVKIK